VFDCDVLIVGGGPVGLFLAAELGQRGISVQVFDAKPGTARHPAANANSARTMEHFRRIGIADEVRAAGLPGDYSPDIAYFTSIGQYELARLSQPSSADAVEWAKQHDFTWPTAEPPHRCSQLYVEPILLKAALQHRCCNVHFSAVVESFEQDEQGVTAIVNLEQTANREARQRKVRARYLIGCDGPRSSVRKALGIRYNGVAGEKRGFMGGQMEAVYFHAPGLYNASRKRPAWQYWTFSPTQRALLIAVDGRGDFIMNVQSQDDQPLDPDLVRKRIATAIGADIPFEIKSSSSWTAGFALVAERLSLGRVFLAGDSAHLFTPTGGLGYNTGIDDAANLAWKLAALVNGSGGAALAESYHAERYPAALRNTAFAREFADSIGHVQLPAAAFEDGPQGDAAREAAGRYLDFHAYREFMIPGVHLGTRYEQSPLLVAEAGSPGLDAANLYLPCARPGHRAPHVWLRDGRSLYALFGMGFTLLTLNADNATQIDSVKLAAYLPGLTCVTVAERAVRELYQADFVLIRPDQHVAWRGNVLDAGFAAVAARALGHEREPAPVHLTEPERLATSPARSEYAGA